ncbi:hypothetical protein DY000_02054342 [Brassica cretica]|uniref:Uncharacterized protein n=1 Tax=Brassica cretica TaxID=69181 RepID=A0ABQ7A6L7_BRACR|nr:hypothetical protein DY000_02054342 [Brassica cretica]
MAQGKHIEIKFDLIKNNQWAGCVSRAAVRSHCDSLASDYASATPWLKGQMMFVDGEHKPYIEESTEETIMTWTMMDEEEDRLLCFALKMFI